MLDTEVYLDKLALFGRILRQEGLFVSPNENEDAANILLELGFADRETVKAALRRAHLTYTTEKEFLPELGFWQTTFTTEV